MSFKPIHRNLQHVPKIWGVSFVKLFASLFAMLIVTLGWFYLVARGFLALAAGAGVGLASYGISFWLDSRDPCQNPGRSSFIRDWLTSYSVSNQTIRIKQNEHL